MFSHYPDLFGAARIKMVASATNVVAPPPGPSAGIQRAGFCGIKTGARMSDPPNTGKFPQAALLYSVATTGREQRA